MLSFFQKNTVLLILFTLALISALAGSYLYYREFGVKKYPTGSVIIPSLSPVASPNPCASYTIDPKENIEGDNYYKVAVYGDSMVETMGEHMDYLKSALNTKYPDKDFVLLNYGIGAENVQMGLERFEKPFVRNERNYIPAACIKPDTIIVGSFAYNPFTPHDRVKHLTLLTELVTKAKKASKSVYLLAEIAPLQNSFGKGPNGVNWPEVAADEHTVKIKEQLENAVALSGTLNVGLINAYQASQTSTGYGNPKYVNPSDGIHPSVAGHIFMATLIANTLRLD